MKLSIVVAAADNGVIGRDNALIWRLPDDLKYFKTLTMGKPIVMGRKTFAAIGRSLPGRTNIVISRQAGLAIDGCRVVDSLDAALCACEDAEEVMIVGGAEIYAQAMPQVDVLYVTQVHAAPEGDVYFPSIDPNEWRETFREAHTQDARHEYAFTFVTYERKRARNIP